jgi:[CysO sulfur-carrier protein]-thiocarboxylate-dependent cysteine synthase
MSTAAMASGVSGGLLDAIGGTPMVELRRLAPPGVRLFAKLEGANPTGSVKDRIARAMVLDALASGALHPGQTILEPSSGNTGISLALVGALLGHPVRIVLPDNTTPEREQLLRLYRADVVFSPGKEGSNGAIRVARELAAADVSLFMPFQYGNPANPRAHYEGTAAEIIRDCPELDVFVAGLGTGGTLMGCSARLKEHRPEIQVVACEPLQGDPVSGLRSLDDGFVPPILDLSRLDRKLLVGNRDALVMTRRLSSEEGIFAGISSGAVVHTCARLAARMDHGTIVGIVCDGGWKYLSAGIWTDDLDDVEDTLDRGLFW